MAINDGWIRGKNSLGAIIQRRRSILGTLTIHEFAGRTTVFCDKSVLLVAGNPTMAKAQVEQLEIEERLRRILPGYKWNREIA